MVFVLLVFMSVWIILIFGCAIYDTYISPELNNRFKGTKEDDYCVDFYSNKIKGEKIKMNLQDKIEKLIKNGWTYGKLAKELGVSKTTISRWAKGECKPSYPYYEEQLDELCKKEQEKNQKNFEVGDVVRICDEDNCFCDDLEVGDKGVITDIATEGYLTILFSKEENLEQYCSRKRYHTIELVEEKEQPKHEFKVGDRVQFKSWEEMEKEFELDVDGDIKCSNTCFTVWMKHLCGTYATITGIDNRRVKLKDFTAKGKTDWFYSTDMIKPVGKTTNLGKIEDVGNYTLDEHIAYYEKQLARLRAQKEAEKWQFTEDEKVILRNIDEKFQYITRDKDGDLFVFSTKPKRNSERGLWCFEPFGEQLYSLRVLKHLFKCIQWSNTEPCEFRKFI